MKAISLRQPWAWLVAKGLKDVENRNWATKFRGEILIHASAHKVTAAEYARFVRECAAAGIGGYPGMDEFELGGIVGRVEIVDCVTGCESRWFWGRYGFLLRNARVLPFRAMKGALGIWEAGEEFEEAVGPVATGAQTKPGRDQRRGTGSWERRSSRRPAG